MMFFDKGLLAMGNVCPLSPEAAASRCVPTAYRRPLRRSSSWRAW